MIESCDDVGAGVLPDLHSRAQCLLRNLLDMALEQGDLFHSSCPPNGRGDCFEVSFSLSLPLTASKSLSPSFSPSPLSLPPLSLYSYALFHMCTHVRIYTSMKKQVLRLGAPQRGQQYSIHILAQNKKYTTHIHING